MFTLRQTVNAIIIDVDSFSDDSLLQLAGLHLPTQLVLFSTSDRSTIASSFPSIVRLSRPLQFISPETLQQNLNTIGGAFSSTAILSADLSTLQGIQRIPIRSIYFAANLVFMYSDCGRLPDFTITDLLDIGLIIDGSNGGNVAEALSCYSSKIRKASFISSQLTNEDGTILKVISGGRYYSREDIRAYIDPLSERIIKNKKTDLDFSIISRIYKFLVQYGVDLPVDGITRVPPKPNIPYDRFSRIVPFVCQQRECIDYSSSLILVDELLSQKGLSRAERSENVKGKFRFTTPVSGKHIVLIDDLITTGATALSCANAIQAMGADKVTIITLAINQFKNDWLENSLRLPRCEDCGARFHIRINTKNRSLFFGCIGYPDCIFRKAYIEWAETFMGLIDHYQFNTP